MPEWLASRGLPVIQPRDEAKRQGPCGQPIEIPCGGVKPVVAKSATTQPQDGTVVSHALNEAAVASQEMALSGPLIWRYAHAGSEVLANAQDRARHLRTVTSLIPCRECRLHWEALIREKPAPLNSAKEFSAWLSDRHNDVRERLQQPKWTPGEG